MMRPEEQIRAFIQKYQCSASWMAEQMGVTPRQIQRINAGAGTRVNAATWKGFMDLVARVEKGELPPTRQQRSDEAVARRKGASGYWGVGKDPLLGKWSAYFSHNKVQRKTCGCETKELAIERAEKMAKALGVSSPKIGTSQMKSLAKPWRAFYHKKVKGRSSSIQLGHFETAEEAARAHDKAARAAGQTKRLNFPS